MAAPPSPFSGPDALPLTLDALYEVLLRLPAKDLCRFRAVCRPWRALLSDSHFVAAHDPGPLIVAGYEAFGNEGVICDIMDLSGNVVKRVRRAWDRYKMPEWVEFIQLDLICMGNEITASYRLLNPATGAVYTVPEELAKEHAAHLKTSIDYCYYKTFVPFGKVASTSEYKVLRVLDNLEPRNRVQLYEVFTLDGSYHSRWRGKKGPLGFINMGLWKSVVIGGIVYFFSYLQDCITSFDLGIED